MLLSSDNSTKPSRLCLDNNNDCQFKKLSLRILKYLDLTRHTNERLLLKIIFWIHVASLGLFSLMHIFEVRSRYLVYIKSQTDADYGNFVFCLIIVTLVVFALTKCVILLFLARRKYETLRYYLRWYTIWNSIILLPTIGLLQYMKFCLISPEASRWGGDEVLHVVLSIFASTGKIYLVVMVMLIDRKLGSKLVNEFQEHDKVDFIRKANLEIPKMRLVTDYSRILGRGQSGVVYYGELLDVTMNSIVHIPVAVKTSSDVIKDEDGTGKTNVEAIIEEIKLLHIIGEHVNVAKLLGVCIQDLNISSLPVAFEFYRNGSLESFLGKIKGDLEANEGGNIVILNIMNKWVYEVANAMEFVSAKNIIHGDIATRNVLISSDLTAKLTDFGLSRKIHNYVNYIKTRQEPLPWRWMSPESLRDLEFSKKSDVWSFGVFTWEVFQFASLVPYFGVSWCSDFVKELENGLIPHKPEFAQENMYNLMKHCWTFNPDQRPTFMEIRTTLQKQMMLET